MSKKAFHIYNFIAFVLLLSFNLLALFGFGMSEGEMTFAHWFPIIVSFFIWGIFYFIQCARSNKTWRITWFGIMLVLLFFWETGLGARIGRMLV